MYTDAFQHNTTFLKKVKHEQLKVTDVFNDYLLACLLCKAQRWLFLKPHFMQRTNLKPQTSFRKFVLFISSVPDTEEVPRMSDKNFS